MGPSRALSRYAEMRCMVVRDALERAHGASRRTYQVRARPGEGVRYLGEKHLRTHYIRGAHPQHRPTRRHQQVVAAKVPCELPRLSMVRAVVFHCHLPPAPPEVDAGDKATVFVIHVDLGLRSRQAGRHAGHSTAGLPRRLRTGVRQGDGSAQLDESSSARMQPGMVEHRTWLGDAHPAQLLYGEHRVRQGEPPPEVIGRAERCGHRHPIDFGDLFRVQAAMPGDDARLRVEPSAHDHFAAGSVRYPPRTKNDRCRPAGEHTRAVRPAPCGLGQVERRRLPVSGKVDVGE